MPAVWLQQGVTVVGGPPDAPETWSDVELLGWNLEPGAAPGACRLRFPRARGLTGLPSLGQEVRVILGSNVMWRGRAVRAPGAVTAMGDGQELVIRDPRWAMERRRIGMLGVGDLLESQAVGGFAQQGHLPVFNPSGLGNRTADPVVTDPVLGDVHGFSSADGAQWTLRDLLAWALYWYGGTLLACNVAALPAAWDAPAASWGPAGMGLSRAVTQLAAWAGEAWGPRFANDATWYQPVRRTPDVNVILDLPGATAGADTGSVTWASVRAVQGDVSIEDSVDQVQALANRQVMETSYCTDAAYEVATLVRFNPAQAEYVGGVRPDVTAYAAHGLGFDLPAGSRPKRWRRELVTQWNAGRTDYLATGTDSVAARRALPEDAVWVDAGEGYVRVTGGFVILPDRAEVLFGTELRAVDGTTIPIADFSEFEDLEVLLTAATELEDGATAWSPAPVTAPHAQDLTGVALVVRTDLATERRWKADLPDPAGPPNAWVRMADGGAPVTYRSILPLLVATANQYAEVRTPRQVELEVELWEWDPGLTLGVGVAAPGSGLEAMLTGDEVVVGMRFDARSGDFPSLRVTNMLAGFVGV